MPVQGKHKDSVKCTFVTAIAPAPVRPTSLKLAKVNNYFTSVKIPNFRNNVKLIP